MGQINLVILNDWFLEAADAVLFQLVLLTPLSLLIYERKC